MKPAILTVLIALLFAAAPAAAQYISDVPRSNDWTGSIVKADTQPKTILGKFGFSMNHSYEMSFSSVGGQGYNQNMYTNTMFFGFSERLVGRVDLALAHSPFGNGLMTQGNEVKFLVRNAELNYRIGDKTNLSVQFSQMPYGYYGYGPGSMGYGAWNRRGNPFHPHY